MGRRSDHSREELRAMVLAEAIRVIDDEGAAALSMRKLAKAIGYTVGTLYLIFPNQDALLLTINLQTAASLQQALSTAVQVAPATTPARLHAIAESYVTFAQTQPHRWRLLFELDADLPEFSEPVQSQVARLFGLIDALFEEQSGAGRPRATAFWAGVHGVATLAVTERLRWSGDADPLPALRSLVQGLAPR